MKKLSRRDLLKAGGVAVAATAVNVSAIPEAEAENKGLPRWAMVVDIRRCVGCRGCTIACKSEYSVPLGNWNTVVKDVEWGKYPNPRKAFIPRLCNHCEGGAEENPPCVEVCPEFPKNRQKLTTKDGKKHRYRDGATFKRPDGVIIINNDACIGCGKCIKACPYGVRSFHPTMKSGKDPKKNGILKCEFCYHRVDKGLVPACVNTCQGEARIFGDLNDPDSQVSKLVKKYDLTTLLPEKGTEPYVFYIDPDKVLDRYKIVEKKKLEEFRDQIV